MKQFKNNSKFNFVKRFLLISLIIFGCNFLSKGQTNSCGCDPIASVEQFIYVTGCSNGPPISSITPNNDGCGYTDANGNYISTTPESAVIIEYTKVVCGGNVAIMFKSATFYGPRYAGGSGYTNQATDYPLAQQGALNAANITGNLNFVYPAGCQTIAEVVYPSPSPCYYFYPEGPLAGQVQSMIDLGNPSPILELLPCDGENCCSLEYTFNPITHRYTLINFNPIQPCASLPPPLTVKSFTCFDKNGKEVTYTGTVTFPHPCESYCGAALNTLYKVAPKKEFVPLPDHLEFNLSPIPATDFITFSSINGIDRTEIYNLKGELVSHQNKFENSSINISDLSKGIYFIRIYFKDTSIRSIKIIKE